MSNEIPESNEGVKRVVYRKLVRDKIPDWIRSLNKTPDTRTLSNEEYREALLAKFLEESKELQDA